MTVTIDHAFFGLIIDTIIDQSSTESLLALRTTSKDFRHRIDRQLFNHAFLYLCMPMVNPSSNDSYEEIDGLNAEDNDEESDKDGDEDVDEEGDEKGDGGEGDEDDNDSNEDTLEDNNAAGHNEVGHKQRGMVYSAVGFGSLGTWTLFDHSPLGIIRSSAIETLDIVPHGDLHGPLHRMLENFKYVTTLRRHGAAALLRLWPYNVRSPFDTVVDYAEFPPLSPGAQTNIKSICGTRRHIIHLEWEDRLPALAWPSVGGENTHDLR